jgi:hypothetical protein
VMRKPLPGDCWRLLRKILAMRSFSMLSRSFIENSALNLYLLRIVYIICQKGGVLGGNGGGLFRNQ